MSTQEIKAGIYSVGVLNPSLRVFDIIMKTDYGTTYNAYLIKDEHLTLVETVHETYWPEYYENLCALCDPSKIEYIIFDHTEPDHSGSLARLLEINPEITVIGSAPALKNIEKIINIPFKSIVAKDGGSLNIGKRTLKFISAPNLHWPDSMFTYSDYDKLAFTCDFLGAHYCEPTLWDTKTAYPKKYAAEFKNYYDAIFSPFKRFVLAGLDKLEPLDVKTVCTSHGPVLSKTIQQAMTLYRLWSTPPAKEGKNALIAYVSAYGYTRKLAETASAQLKKAGYTVKTYDLVNGPAPAEEIHAADLLLLGSPTINRDALRPIWDLIASLDAINISGKRCGLFGSYGWSGEAVPMLKNRLTDLKLKVIGEGFRCRFRPSESELEAFKAYLGELTGD